jgi:hypothetical protein
MGGKERSMTVLNPSRKPETMLQKETRIFREELGRLGNCILNKTFDLTLKGSQRRNQALIILFLLLGMFFTISTHPLAAWGEEIGLFFQYLFNPSFAQATHNGPAQFFNFAFGAILAPQTLRYLPIFILPFIFALQAAATYLADIFELEKVEIARDFIWQVALIGSRQTIHIGKGDIIEKDKNSPVSLIGGPGQVVVELDTAALFEKPNGKPRVIGPTVKGKAILEGFERFRQAIDLRDQYTDPLDVKSRSLDGIPVSTKDVRLLFSVARGENGPTAISPYPFEEKAIQTLVYGQTSKVVLNGPHPSEPPSSWTGTIQSLIRGELGGFMSKHRLAEYLASIGAPEVKKARQRESKIVKIGKAVLAEGDELERRKVPSAPVFHPRTVVSNLFSQFAVDFSKNASKRGVQLSWIGVGTWKTPNEIIPEKHLEAWRLSRENLARSNQGELDGLRNETQLQQTLRLVQNIPLARFQQNRGKQHKDIIQDLLIAYREQLIEAIELLTKSNQKVPSIIGAAIKHIEGVLGIKHWVGAASSTSGGGAPRPSPRSSSRPRNHGRSTGIPPALPSTPEEAELYIDLLIKAGRDAERVERLIEYERNLAPHAERIELIRRAIERWLKDNR